MSDTTRRRFLGLLAHLPLVGAWFAFSKTTSAPLSSRKYGNATPFSEMVRHIIEEKKTMRIIRWIPVTERLPEMENRTSAGGGVIWPWKSSSRLLVVACGTVVTGRLIQLHDDLQPSWENSADIEGVTHWAKLPAPPEVSS